MYKLSQTNDFYSAWTSGYISPSYSHPKLFVTFKPVSVQKAFGILQKYINKSPHLSEGHSEMFLWVRHWLKLMKHAAGNGNRHDLSPCENTDTEYWSAQQQLRFCHKWWNRNILRQQRNWIFLRHINKLFLRGLGSNIDRLTWHRLWKQ